MMAKKTSQTGVRRTPLFSLITACSLLNSSLAEQSRWLFDSQFEGSNCMNTTPIIQTSSKLQCATLCDQLNGCVGFFYKKDTLSCLLIDPTSSSVCTINNSLEWSSWKKSSGQSVVTTVSSSTAASTIKITTTEKITSPTKTVEQTPTPTTPTEQTTTSTSISERTTIPTTEQTTTTGQTTTPTTTTDQTTTPTTATDQTTTPTTTTQQTTTPTTTTEQTTTPTATTPITTTPTTSTEQTTTPTATTPTTSTEQTTTLIRTLAQPTCPIMLPMETYASTTLSDNTQFTFLFVQDAVNQAIALSRCPNYNGTLIQITTAPKMDFLMDCLDKTFGNDYSFWMDAIKVDGLWKTSDEKAVLNDENYWEGGLTSGTKPCAVLQGVRYNYKMNAILCGNPRPFICEKVVPPICPITLPMDTYTSTTLSDNTQFTFLFVQDAVNQAVALNSCPNYNGTLIQITTSPKMAFLMDCLDKTFGNDYSFWIDAIKVDGLWKTSDNKAVLSDENYWEGGLTSGTKPCAVLQGVRYNYKMNAILCGNPRPFICEKTN